MDMKGMNKIHDTAHKHMNMKSSKSPQKKAVQKKASSIKMSQHNMMNMDGKKHPSSKGEKLSPKINMKGMDMSRSKKDTIKAMNDPMKNMKMDNESDTTKMIRNDTKSMDMDKMKMDDKNKSPAKDSVKMDDHDMMNMKGDTAKPGKQDNQDMKMNMPMDHGMMQHKGMNMDMMNDAFSLNLPMERHGSGTGWVPDASPMNGYMFHRNKWMYMLHGNLFIRYNKQDISNKGSRGGKKFDAPNWLMFMGQKKVGDKGLFHFSTMLSLDLVTIGGSGYPLLFQSGEAFKGKALVDRQHPHDLFSELSVSYSHAFSKNTDVFIYVGYPGEPALGPVAFMHRPAALYNPDAPLSHHWSDATHITFGVATLGVRLGDVKIDGSLFTGREPNDIRYDFDKPRFDSWSGRLSYNLSGNWALQVSHGFLKSPEELHPGEDVNRTTASVIYARQLKNNGWINLSSVYGLNKSKDHTGENSFLLEGSWNRKRLAVYSRYEYVQKSAEELSLDENVYGHDVVFPVNAFTLGVNYDVLQLAKTRLSAGTQFSYYNADERLNPLYGKNPMAVEVYLRIYPALMKVHNYEME